MIPVAGQMVVVRNRPGVVRDVVAYGGNGSGGMLHLVELEYLDGWEHPGQESVLWEREVAPRVLDRRALPDIAAPASRPDEHNRFGAYLDAVRWSATARAGPASWPPISRAPRAWEAPLFAAPPARTAGRRSCSRIWWLRRSVSPRPRPGLPAAPAR